MKNFILLLAFLFSVNVFSQGSTLGRSYASLNKELSQDNRIKIDYSYRGGSKSFLKVDFLTVDAFQVYEFSNGYVFKENLIMRNQTVEDWARRALGLEDSGWTIVSKQIEEGNYAARLSKNNLKVLVAFSPSDKIVGIITTRK